MGNQYYEWTDKVYPCEATGVCPGYSGCSAYPICVGWEKKENKEDN